MTEQPITAAGLALLTELNGNYAVLICRIEAEARQQDGSALREVVERYRSGHNFGVTTEECACDLCKDARLALTALPPSAPPALDVDVLASWLCEKFHRGPKMTWPLERCGIREQHLSDAAEYARLQEQDR